MHDQAAQRCQAVAAPVLLRGGLRRAQRGDGRARAQRDHGRPRQQRRDVVLFLGGGGRPQDGWGLPLCDGHRVGWQRLAQLDLAQGASGVRVAGLVQPPAATPSGLVGGRGRAPPPVASANARAAT